MRRLFLGAVTALSLPPSLPGERVEKGKIMNSICRKIVMSMAILALGLPTAASAATAAEIDQGVAEALKVFAEQVDGSEVFLNQAAGYLVFPRVIKGGIGVGAEWGDGALRIGGASAGYYRTVSGSIGFQLGAQAKSIIIAFMTKEALDKFTSSDGWSVGIDGSVALIDIGAGKTIDSNNVKDPVVGFIFGSKGLMYNLTLEGSKITKLDKS
jgi:lipid-binding SYLF domain-containing protein